MTLWALGKDDSRRALKIEGFWPHKRLLVLKFAGIDSISDAETLSGCQLQVPREQRAPLEPGWIYISDLVGCTVFDGEREIGAIQEVRFGAGEAPLLVVKAGSKEYEIPYADAYLQAVELWRGQVRMRLPEGMLEVNAPLTAEEKEQQKKEQQARKRQ
jgi:16S rRNA processing protein RimM